MSEWNGFGGLDLSGVEEDSGYRAMQPGEHVVKAIEAKVEQIGNTSNRKVVVDFRNANGEGIRNNFNIHHTSQQAQEIGLRQLKAFLVAGGHPNPDKPGDIASLKGLKCQVIVGMGKPWTGADGRERQSPEIKAFRKLEASKPAAEAEPFSDAIPF